MVSEARETLFELLALAASVMVIMVVRLFAVRSPNPIASLFSCPPKISDERNLMMSLMKRLAEERLSKKNKRKAVTPSMFYDYVPSKQDKHAIGENRDRYMEELNRVVLTLVDDNHSVRITRQADETCYVLRVTDETEANYKNRPSLSFRHADLDTLYCLLVHAVVTGQLTNVTEYAVQEQDNAYDW